MLLNFKSWLLLLEFLSFCSHTSAPYFGATTSPIIWHGMKVPLPSLFSLPLILFQASLPLSNFSPYDGLILLCRPNTLLISFSLLPVEIYFLAILPAARVSCVLKDPSLPGKRELGSRWAVCPAVLVPLQVCLPVWLRVKRDTSPRPGSLSCQQAAARALSDLKIWLIFQLCCSAFSVCMT